MERCARQQEGQEGDEPWDFVGFRRPCPALVPKSLALQPPAMVWQKHQDAINPDLWGVLNRLEPAGNPDTPVFPRGWTRGRVSMAFRRIAHRAELRGFRFHDLRHDFASWLTMNGVAIQGVQTLLGHADLRMTERYSYLADRVLAAAVEAPPPLTVTAPQPAVK